MNERLVALERGGRLRLMATNGDQPREVASMELGEVDETTAAMVGAALADLRAMVTAKQRPARSSHPLEPYLTNDGAPRPAKALPDPPERENVDDNLRGRLMAMLRTRGPMTSRMLTDALRPQGTARSSPMKRVANSLHHLQLAGLARRDVAGMWSLTDGDDAQADAG